jgi:hypothetical protein
MFKISLETLKEIKKQLRHYEGLLEVIAKSPQSVKRLKKIKKLNKGLDEYNT